MYVHVRTCTCIAIRSLHENENCAIEYCVQRVGSYNYVHRVGTLVACSEKWGKLYITVPISCGHKAALQRTFSAYLE